MNGKIFFLICFMFFSFVVRPDQKHIIRIHTDDLDLIYRENEAGRLSQCYFGKRLRYVSDLDHLSEGNEAYIGGGMEDSFEPAVTLVHNDGNPSLLLTYVSDEKREIQPGVEETVIVLKDEKYPVEVKLHYTAYGKENVVKTWTEIKNGEKKTVSLYKYASSMLHFGRSKYYLREYSGDWAREVASSELPLDYGKKVLDSRLGTRADKYSSPFFQVSFDQPAEENHGEVFAGTLGWTGNFRFVFEVDNKNDLRIVSEINPESSAYELQSGGVFRTPDFYFTYSYAGLGKASRNFHDWARRYQIKEGMNDRMTLLNNWETTSFDFNEQKLRGLIGDAAGLGVDLFLLDDGWFGNKYPRNSDHQGLGDWEETKAKLPRGLGYLTEMAKEKGVKFGLWIEPEMVNPKSELYEKHPEWVFHFPNREVYYERNQMVLDLTNPRVQDYVFGIVDGLRTKYPGISYFKWDCNSTLTNTYSPYLKGRQSNLYIDYVRGLYQVFEKIQRKYPDLDMMLCSGGGGRTDYEAMKYFTEFWASDNTDPVERLFIEWGYSQFFPVKTICSHVTSWNREASIKFRTDVASMCKLGFDINLSELGKDELAYCKEAVKNYNRLKGVILDGDQYRLASPYEGNHSSTMYVSKDKRNAVVFSFDIHPRYGERVYALRMEGLRTERKYRVEEINLMSGVRSDMKGDRELYSGEYLMTVGLNVFTDKPLNSRVIELREE